MSSQITKTAMIETALLKALSIRENYENYINYVDTNKLLIETQTLLDAIHNYYNLYDHVEIDWTTFLTQFCSNLHAQDMNSVDLDMYKSAIKLLSDYDIQDARASLIGLMNKQLLDNIKTASINNVDSEKIRLLLDTYDQNISSIIRSKDDGSMTSDDVDFESIDKSKGISYYLEPLQDALGGMVPGSLVVINAASGVGKSAFLHGQIVHTLKHLKYNKISTPVLWFNTEGTKSEVFARLWSNMYQEKFENGYSDVLKNKSCIQENFKRLGYRDLLRVFTANNIGLSNIRLFVKKYNPCLIVLDMAAHIATPEGKNTTDTKLLENFFNGLRRLSSEHCPVLCTVQAGAGAKWWNNEKQKFEYKQWPTDDDIYGSRTAVQGSAETIITIGRDNEHQFTRYIQTTKKKALQSAKFICELEEKYSCYKLKTILQ